MKLKVYTVYIDDGEHVYKEITPAESEERAKMYWKGNGEIIAVKENQRMTVETEGIAKALDGYSQESIDLITRTLEIVGLAK